MSSYDVVIGLEIHAELNTASKLFSNAPNRFGDEPNTNISEVCTGQPGALPVLNKEAVRKAILFGLAIDGDVRRFSKFDRKSYFYPDSPRNFQITQFDKPIIIGGTITIQVDGEERKIAIDRAHLEDDAGMLKHFTNFTGVDYNRAGVPLIEIVSTPTIHSPKEAALFAQEVRSILLYLDVSDCNMEEGSLRIDANISLKPKGASTLGTKCEIKNMNSFNFLEEALNKEIARQTKELSEGRAIRQATYRYNGDKGTLELMRYKERAEDYRYFPEPDLPPLILQDAMIDEARSKLPELPRVRKKRYLKELGLSEQQTLALTQEKKLSDYFEKALLIAPYPHEVANWILVEFGFRAKEKNLSLYESSVLPESIGELVSLIKKGTITGKIAKTIADSMIESGEKPSAILEKNRDLLPLSDPSEIEKWVDEAIAANPQSVIDYKAGKTKALAQLIGQVMKATRGKADPDLVNALFTKKLS